MLNKQAVRVLFYVSLLVLLLSGCGTEAERAAGDTSPGSEISKPQVAINMKDLGIITVELDPSAAPITVDNFLKLADQGFYDGLTFHRIIKGFMMQGGDPNGNGTGGSGYYIKGEFSKNGVKNPLLHTRGAISMARAKNKDSASSQFFIMQEDNTSLDGLYAVFGYVTDGMDIVDAICEAANPVDNNGNIRAEEQPVIESITILSR